MSRAEELRAKAQRTANRRAAPDEQPRSVVPQVKAKPIRKTVDLPPQRYSALTSWCAEAAGELGVTRVTGQAVINALIARLLTDETLAAKLRSDLADQLSED